ncbi:MAG: LysR family transcriptional regulator [Xanthobacteraceae bacterium]|nr:LysR family transcriptional regulator [Xanthobacteraceae bacterium]
MSKITDLDDHIGRRLRLRDLRVFFSVVQSGSLAKAAAQLRVSQPAVSQVIVELERCLGARLFDRSSRGMEPTIYGHALFARGRAAFDELRQGIRDIEFLADPTSGEVRIGSASPITDTLLPAIIQRVRQQYPRIVIQVDDVPLPPPVLDLSGLRERRHDLVLTRWTPGLGYDPASDLKVETLFEDRMVVAAGIQNRLARRRSIDLAELVGEPWILAPPSSSYYLLVAEAFRSRNLEPPKASLITLSVPLRTSMLANGPYVTAFANSVVTLNPNRQSLKVLPVDFSTRPRSVVVLRLKGRTLSPVVERFIECAREVAKLIVADPRRSKLRATTAIEG